MMEANKIPTVALVDDIHDNAFNAFQEAGFNTLDFPRGLGSEEVSEFACENNVEILGIRSTPEVLAEGIEANPQLAAIGCFGTGVGVDIEAANEAGVAIINSPKGNNIAVRDYVIGMTYNLLGGLSEYNQRIQAGVWDKGGIVREEIDSKVLGCLGMGNIAKLVAERAALNGMTVVAYDPDKSQTSEFAEMLDSKEAVLESCDVLSPHVPKHPSTDNMMDDDAFERMKEGSYFINASRASVVDPYALRRAVESGHLAGAAVDVHENEPAKGQRFASILRGVDNLILTPHIAGSERKVQPRIGAEVAGKLIEFWLTGSTNHTVNFPHLQLTKPRKGVTRLIYPHSDKTGALADVTDILTEADLNIGKVDNAPPKSGNDGEGELAYAYFDITKGEVTPSVMKLLGELALTRRVRAIPPIN